jgi:hypothetical protein
MIIDDEYLHRHNRLWPSPAVNVDVHLVAP